MKTEKIKKYIINYYMFEIFIQFSIILPLIFLFKPMMLLINKNFLAGMGTLLIGAFLVLLVWCSIFVKIDVFFNKIMSKKGINIVNPNIFYVDNKYYILKYSVDIFVDDSSIIKEPITLEEDYTRDYRYSLNVGDFKSEISKSQFEKLKDDSIINDKPLLELSPSEYKSLIGNESLCDVNIIY